MALTDCSFCNRARCGAITTQEGFFAGVARLICEIAEFLQTIVTEGIPVTPSSLGQVVPLYAEVLYSAITGSFVAAITDSHEKLGAKIENATNQPILVSFDGTNVHEFVGPSTAVVYDWAREGTYEARNIYIKYASDAPTAGSVYVSARY